MKSGLSSSIIINIILTIIIIVLLLNKFGILHYPGFLNHYSYMDNPRYTVDLSVFQENTEQIDIVFAGDSFTERCPFDELLHASIIKRGIPGDITEGLLNRIDEIITHEPKKIFIMIGLNDIDYKIKKEETVANYNTIISMIQKELPDCEVYVESILPVNNDNRKNQLISDYNKSLVEMSNKYDNCYYIDLSELFINEKGNVTTDYYTSDGVHLNGEGYSVWLQAIKKYVYY